MSRDFRQDFTWLTGPQCVHWVQGFPEKKEIINHFMFKNQKYVFFHGTIIPIIDIQSTCDRNEWLNKQW